MTADTFGNIDHEVFFDDLHLNNKIGTRRLVTNIKSRTGLRIEGNREQANRRQYNSSRLQNRRWNPSTIGSLVWDDNAKYELCRLLESVETKNRLNTALNNNNVNTMTDLFTQNLIEVCKQAGLRFNNATRKHIEKQWFDEQCKIVKENLKSLGRHISRNPNVEELRSSLHKKKKRLSNTCAEKRNADITTG